MLFHEIEICSKYNCITINGDAFRKALELRSKAIEQGDVRTRWWIRLLTAIFKSTDVGGQVTFTFTDTSGNNRTQYVKNAISGGAIIFNTASCNNRFFIVLGTGTKTPTIDDYKLEAKISESIAQTYVDENNGVIELHAEFMFTQDTTIREVGLEWEATVYGASTCGRILVDRTLVSPPFIAPAYTPISVTYRIIV
jgi:hypothetical protein